MNKTSSEIIIDGIIENISQLKIEIRNPSTLLTAEISSTQYHKDTAYNKAIDGVIQLLKGNDIQRIS